MSKGLTTVEELISDHIYSIRGLKVMIDHDLAELYEVETRVLNQAVNRNLDRFPEDFMFQLNESEWKASRSQFVMSKHGRGGRRTLPFAFTEYGVLMLSSVLNSDKAVMTNIQIVRIFARMRQFVTDSADLRMEIEHIKTELNNQGKNIEVVFQYLDELIQNKKVLEERKPIGYKP